MRHLVFSYHTCPLEEPGTALAGGMNVYLRGLLPALSGVETLVLTSGVRFEELAFQGVRVWRLPCRGPVWDRQEAYRALPRFVDLCRERLSGSWDALSAHYWMSGLACRSLFPESLPVMMFHSLDPGRNPVRAEAEARLASDCPTVFSSGLDRTVSAMKLPLRESHVIRPGVDPSFCPRPQREARARLGLPLEERLVGLVARDDPAKNAPLAREGAGRAGLRLIETPGPLWPGGLPHAEMPWFYAAMDLVVSLSEYETFGLSVLEALACGCRVLVSPRGYWGGVARHTGLLRVASRSDLAGDMLRALSDPAPRLDLLRRHFSWKRAAERWAERLRRA